MKKLNYFLLTMALLLSVPVWQSCDDDDDYYVVCPPASSWDWGTVCATGGGGYYVEGDNYGKLIPAATPSFFHPVDGERVVVFFNPLGSLTDGTQADVLGVQEVLTKNVELMDAENEEQYGNDPIRIYQGDMWLGGKYLNLIFEQKVPAHEPHLIILVRNVTDDSDTEGEETAGETESDNLLDADGYVNLELRYNTYGDVTDKLGWGYVSYNLSDYYALPEYESGAMKGFKVTIHSETNGEGVVVVLDFDKPVGVPEQAGKVHEMSSFVR